MKPPLGAPDRLVIRAKAWQQKTKRYREQSRSCASTDPEPFASCCDRVSRCVVFGARIRGPNTGHAREAVNFDRWRVMVSFATCSFSVDEAFACLFTHRRVSVFINSTHSHEPGLSEFQDRTGQAIQDQPSLNWGQSSAGQAIIQ